MKKLLSIGLVITMLFSIVACSGAKKESTAAANTTTTEKAVEESKAPETKAPETVASGEKVIRIGVFEPQSGENSGGGIQEVYGIRYANKIYNTVKIGGEDYKIELYEVDNKSDDKEAVPAAQRLISGKVSVVLGSYGSSVSRAAGGHFKAAKIPAIGCSCTNPNVTSLNEYYFRTCYLDPFQGKVMASYCVEKGYKKVAVLTQRGDDYSKGLGNNFVSACKEKGIDVVANENFPKDSADFKGNLTNIKAANPDFIFAPTSVEAAPIILSQARDLDITCQIGAGDTWENGRIIANSHGAAEGVVVTTFYEANPDTATGEEAIFLKGNGEGETATGFLDYLKANIPTEESIPAVSALGYDAYLAAYKAIEKAQSTNGEDIRNALTTLEYVGVTGPISFDEKGDAKKNSAYIKEIKDGAFVFKDVVTIN